MYGYHRFHRLVSGGLVSLIALSFAAACSSSTSNNTAACPAYNADILNPRPLAADLNPTAAMPPIESMPSTSASLGTMEALKPTWYTELKVTADQQQSICAKHLTGVYLDWSGVPFNQAIREGIKDVFAALGIKLLRITDYSFNPSGFTGDLAALLPLHPNIVMTGGAISPEQFATIMQPAISQGAIVTTWGLGARQWKTGAGQPLKTVVGYDFYHLGVQLADAIHAAYPNGANFGYIHWVNNSLAIHDREQGMLDQLKKYSNIRVVTNGNASPDEPNSGYTDFNASQAYTVAFLKAHPDVNVLFAPWEDPPAIGESAAIAALHAENTVHIATMDLGTQGATELVKGGIINIDMAQGMYDGGRSMALSAALSTIGGKIYPYVIVPTTPATKDNVTDAWTFMHGPNLPIG
jgi:ribose transport system substrate-binding protein